VYYSEVGACGDTKMHSIHPDKLSAITNLMLLLNSETLRATRRRRVKLQSLRAVIVSRK
jgi:hypothetical protein